MPPRRIQRAPRRPLRRGVAAVPNPVFIPGARGQEQTFHEEEVLGTVEGGGEVVLPSRRPGQSEPTVRKEVVAQEEGVGVRREEEGRKGGVRDGARRGDRRVLAVGEAGSEAEARPWRWQDRR